MGYTAKNNNLKYIEPADFFNLKILVWGSSKNLSVILLSGFYSDSSSIKLRTLIIHING